MAQVKVDEEIGDGGRRRRAREEKLGFIVKQESFTHLPLSNVDDKLASPSI